VKTTSSVLDAYGRRTLYTTLSLSVLLSSGPGSMFVALAQNPPASQEKSNTGAREQQGRSQPGNRERLRIVPIQRKQNTKPDAKQNTPPNAKQGEVPGAKPGDKPGTVIQPNANDPGRAAPQNPNVPKPEGPPITLPGGNNQREPGGGAFGGRAGTPFSFDFRGADITNVLKFYAQMSGLTITTDPGLSGQVTIINPKPVTLDEAFRVLQAVLSVRGFAAQQTGNVLSIVPTNIGTTIATQVNGDLDQDLDPRNQIMTQVIPLDNVDAEALARELTPLISKGASLIGSPGTNSLIMTDSASNIQRFITLVDALDKTSNNSELMVYPLRYAEATAIADIINNLYRQTTSRGRGGGQPGQPGQPQMMQQPGQPGQPGAGGGGRPAVVATPDVRTNQVLVVASPANQLQIARDIINRLDDDGSNTLDTVPRKIKYSDATQIASQVNQILSGMRLGGSDSGSRNPSFRQRAFGGDFGFFGGGGGNQQSGEVTPSTDPFGKVTADQRTNTIFITASAERMRKINELVDLLDVDVPVEATTFVIPLKNAQADDVAYALAQAFSTGQQQNNNPFGFFFGGGGNQNNQRTQGRQPINRRLGSQNNNRSARMRGVPPGPPNAPGGDYDDGTTGSAIPDGVPGVMTPNGFVPTDVPVEDERTRQFFFGGQQRRLGQNTGPQFGRGRTGTFSNLLQLQNNVFVTPSPYGDSLIVTTTPDNYKTLTDLIQQLDVVQPQVMIEVIIAEVTLDKNEKMGFSIGARLANLFGKINNSNIQLNLPSPGSGTNFDIAAQGAQATLSGANYDGLIQALNTDSKVRVLSTPRVFTSNNQQAIIEIVTEIPYVSGQNITPGTNGNIISNVIERQNVGFTLTVTPRIARQGLVTIDVASETSDLLRFDVLGSGDAAQRQPVVNTRYTDTSVTVMDSETIVIGGLIRESSTLNLQKIPILSEIPLIGQFFRSREKATNRVELMVFMTPRVVRSVEEARELTKRQGNLVLPNAPNLKKIEPNLDPNRKAPDIQTPPNGNGQPDNRQQSPPDNGQPPRTGTSGG
jgi:general secretion pathway protein D